MANAMTDQWLKDLDKKADALRKKMELEERVRNDPEYKAAQEKFKAICEGLNERRKIAADEEFEVFKRVLDRIAKEMGYTKKEEIGP